MGKLEGLRGWGKGRGDFYDEEACIRERFRCLA